MRLRKAAPDTKLGEGWPSAATGLRVQLDLGFLLKRGLAPQTKPGPLWSLQECQGMPQGHSHLAAEDERMQHGHFNCVHATPLTKVLLAASLSFWHVEEGEGDR